MSARVDARVDTKAAAANPYGPAYPALLAVSALFALAAIATLIPWPGAPWPNVLGYKSLCSFAPGSTLGCAILAAATCALRARFVKRAPGPAFVTVGAFVLLVGLFAWSTVAWAGVKTQYTDGTSAASAKVVAPTNAATAASATP
jgi:hypothetical protein